MPDLLLHIGHHKTGSTFIQNTLRANRDALARDRGIDYAERDVIAAKNPITGVSTGNAKGLLATETALRDAGVALRCDPARHLLLSSEDLLEEMVQHDDLRFLEETARDLGFDRVRILLFIRDPIAAAASLWQQDVKNGSTESIEARFARYAQPEMAARLLDLVEPLDGLELTIRNYSRCEDRLLAVFTGWLGFPADTLIPLPVKRVNRSLSQGELALKLALNRTVGPDTTFISRAINARSPELRLKPTVPSRDVQAALLARLGPAIARVNAQVGPSGAYGVELRDPSPLAEPFSFTSEQIDVLAEGIGGEIAQLRAVHAQIQADASAHLSIRNLARSLIRRLAWRARGGRRTAPGRRHPEVTAG